MMNIARAGAILAPPRWLVVMILHVRRYLHHPAPRAILLRGGLVAGHMAVLFGLAFMLGLDSFGAAIVLWGLALVGATLLGLGGPLILLARLGGGQGMHPVAVLMLCFGLPGGLAAAAYPVLSVVWAGVPWAAVLAAGLAIHLAACLASILRAMGSVHLSMVLRDGAPVCALGLAGMVQADAGAMMWLAAIALGLSCGLIALICLRQAALHRIIGRGKPRGMVDVGLWASSVMGMALAQVDIILGGQFLTPEQIGVYALVRRLANLVALPISVATWVNAGPISAAHAASDTAALQRASTAGADIAIWPGVALAVLILPLAWWLPVSALPVLLALVGGTLVQLVFAQGITVASLTGRGNLAARARLAGVVCYLAGATAFAPLDPLGNALAYVLGTSLCGALLWMWLWRGTGVNTLAFHKGARAWRMS